MTTTAPIAKNLQEKNDKLGNTKKIGKNWQIKKKYEVSINSNSRNQKYNLLPMIPKKKRKIYKNIVWKSYI